jgi:hypothetical protein
MGEWTVRLSAFGDDGATHAKLEVCGPDAANPCYPIVEEHQMVDLGPTVPTFSITTGYSASYAWWYKLRAATPDGPYAPGTPGAATTGFPSRERAMEAAEKMAKQITVDMIPEKTYEFTPEI